MERKLRRSRKREAILKVMRDTGTHPCAEWVYTKLKGEFPDLSLGTVYRNIAQFQASGDVVRVATVRGQDRYDADTSEHTHFICARCGDIQDVGVPVDGSLARMAEGIAGARVDEARLTFGGLCAGCLSLDISDASPQKKEEIL